ncbi:MAG: alanine--tRNA ligase [Oscillospiraceae bacterium]|jgi:alanyl-tRNA synthetase|nr:alanine--tRNA ligase [Oscillospiraceae bacterium]
MEKFGLNELRERFLSFFESKGHLRLPSFSLVPQGDKSLLLINSGMAPMKPWFTGEQEPPSKRVCTCQKCIRTGDIDNIGKTARHGTYFEMLGNFSFGDYFKEDAIAWCWEFLTEDLGIDAALLYPSVYFEDDEAFDIWRDKIGIAPERIAKLGKADNFWEHGSGPCGPCSEVYYDRGEKYSCGKPDCAPGCDCDRFIEVWNNVFTQFDNDGNNNYTELSQKNIDTGLGLERLAVVCQGVDSLFDVDTVMAITNRVSELTGARYGLSPKSDVSLRIITDHLRSAVMMACDGVLPSNEGRGYVLRRLLRRAARHGRLLGVRGPFLADVAETVIRMNETAYPETREREKHIKSVVAAEEEAFGRTIDGGLAILENVLAAAEEAGRSVVSGEDAFRLYDTYGFPIDLTLELAEERGKAVDTAGFDALMREQRERARAARLALGDFGWEGFDFGGDRSETEFVGYKKDRCGAKITAIIADGELVESIAFDDGREAPPEGGGTDAVIVLDRTPFYAEMGGQSADRGEFFGNGLFVVNDVKKSKGGKYLHYGRLVSGAYAVGEPVAASISTPRRRAIERSHSATHLLHSALRLVLGEHAHQAGSLVEPDRLRFDFTHAEALTGDELARVEDIVNAAILAGSPVTAREMPIDEAKKLGAAALFGEKYGNIVRVVTMDGEAAGLVSPEPVSIELCGGTHLDNTAKIGAFHITAEFSVASGVRRIEAVTGRETLDALRRAETRLMALADVMKLENAGEIEQRVSGLMRELRELRREAEAYAAKAAGGEAAGFLAGARRVGDLLSVTAALPAASPERLRQIGDVLRERSDDVVAVLASNDGDKLSFLAVCGKNAVARGIKAGELVKEVTKVCGGSGGGKPDSAMGGGRDVSKLDDALAIVDDFILGKTGAL